MTEQSFRISFWRRFVLRFAVHGNGNCELNKISFKYLYI